MILRGERKFDRPLHKANFHILSPQHNHPTFEMNSTYIAANYRPASPLSRPASPLSVATYPNPVVTDSTVAQHQSIHHSIIKSDTTSAPLSTSRNTPSLPTLSGIKSSSESSSTAPTVVPATSPAQPVSPLFQTEPGQKYSPEVFIPFLELTKKTRKVRAHQIDKGARPILTVLKNLWVGGQIVLTGIVYTDFKVDYIRARRIESFFRPYIRMMKGYAPTLPDHIRPHLERATEEFESALISLHTERGARKAVEKGQCFRNISFTSLRHQTDRFEQLVGLMRHHAFDLNVFLYLSFGVAGTERARAEWVKQNLFNCSASVRQIRRWIRDLVRAHKKDVQDEINCVPDRKPSRFRFLKKLFRLRR